MRENFCNHILDKGLTSKKYKELSHFNNNNNKKLIKMGRRTKQTFSQRRHKNGQQAHEKMFNVNNYHRKANQNDNKKSSNTCWIGCHQEETVGSDTDAGKREPLYIAVGNKNWSNHQGNYMEISHKIKNRYATQS